MPIFGDQQVIGLTLAESRIVQTLGINGKFPAGTLGYTQDGRWFRYARNGASTLVPGNVLTSPVPVTNHVNNTATATAAGANTITFTQSNTAITAGQYQDGWLSISVTPGAGFIYGLREGAAVASATANTYNLAPGETVQVALTTTSRIDLVANPYRGVIQCPTTTLAAAPVGVAVSAPTANQWCWIQVKGAANVLTDGTVIIGNFVMVPSTNTAGAVVAGGATEAVNNISVPIGQVLRAAASTAWSTVSLNLLN